MRHSYIIQCQEVIKNKQGEVIELKCQVDLDTLGKNPEGRKVKGIIHWVEANTALPLKVNLYDRLFNDPNPGGHGDKSFLDFLNPQSLKTLETCYGERNLKEAQKGEFFQFERVGYFTLDQDSQPNHLIFNRSVGLRDTWK